MLWSAVVSRWGGPKNVVALGAEDAVTRRQCSCPYIWLTIAASSMLETSNDFTQSLNLAFFSHMESLANQDLYLELSSFVLRRKLDCPVEVN